MREAERIWALKAVAMAAIALRIYITIMFLWGL
jgi:hypothetical protein